MVVVAVALAVMASSLAPLPPSPDAVLMGLVKLSELIRREGGPHFRVLPEEGGAL